MEKLESRIALIISYIFHPVFMPLYSLLLLFNLKSFFSFEIVFKARLMLTAFVFTTTILFPLLIIMMMKRQGLIRSYRMETKQERIYPYLVIAIFYFLNFNMFRQLELPEMYVFFALGSAIILFVVAIVNLWWKISTHMIGVGGVFGLIAGISLRMSMDMTFPLMAAILLAGIIGYARLKLNAHKPVQVYTGFLAGVGIMICVFLFL